MYACFAGNDVNDVHLVVLGECSLLRCGFDQPIDCLITYLPHLLIHALSQLRFPLRKKLSLNSFLLPALHDLLSVYVLHYLKLTIFKQVALPNHQRQE